MPIVNKILNKKTTIVYNMSVEEDESYVANGIVCHNCRCRSVPFFKELEEEREDLITEDFATWMET